MLTSNKCQVAARPHFREFVASSWSWSEMDDGFHPAMVEEYEMLWEEEEEEVVERETDKLVRVGDEWALREKDELAFAGKGVLALGWEVGLAVASGTHHRLGAGSPLSWLGDTDLLIEVLKRVEIVVPEHCETLKEALILAFDGQHIFVRKVLECRRTVSCTCGFPVMRENARLLRDPSWIENLGWVELAFKAIPRPRRSRRTLRFPLGSLVSSVPCASRRASTTSQPIRARMLRRPMAVASGTPFWRY